MTAAPWSRWRTRPCSGTGPASRTGSRRIARACASAAESRPPRSAGRPRTGRRICCCPPASRSSRRNRCSSTASSCTRTRPALSRRRCARAKRIQRLKVGVVATVAALAFLAVVSAFLANHQRTLAPSPKQRRRRKPPTSWFGLFEVSDPSEARGNSITAREIMDQGAKRIQKELSGATRASRRLSWRRWARCTRASACTTRPSRCCRARSRSAGRCTARSISTSPARWTVWARS